MSANTYIILRRHFHAVGPAPYATRPPSSCTLATAAFCFIRLPTRPAHHGLYTTHTCDTGHISVAYSHRIILRTRQLLFFYNKEPQWPHHHHSSHSRIPRVLRSRKQSCQTTKPKSPDPSQRLVKEVHQASSRAHTNRWSFGSE